MARLSATLGLLLLIATQNAFADTTHDQDLTGGRARIMSAPAIVLPVDQLGVAPRVDSAVQVAVLRMDHGKYTPVPGLKFEFEGLRAAIPTDGDGKLFLTHCPLDRTRLRATVRLAAERFSVGNGTEPYRFELNVECGKDTTLYFKQDSDGGQALGIWQITHKAERLFEKTVGLEFWDTPLEFVWPDSADYYSWFQVHITRGDYWDVVGHELGHGIYDLARIGAFGGGQHKIDECYSDALALSEGWASYLSAVLSVAADDADAKFEHMVPRRAPIRFETIPADVCKGPRNEWRVTGFFWDLYDLHDDGETGAESFARVWNALATTKVKSAGEAATRLQRAGIDPALLNLIWSLNFGVAR